MRLTTHTLPPSSSLPPLGTLTNLTETEILSALRDLCNLYCPLSVCLCAALNPAPGSYSSSAKIDDTTFVDSGYTSEAEGSQEHAAEARVAAIRADTFERSHAERWLTGYIARAGSLPCFACEEDSQTTIDQAACILESLVTGVDDEFDLQEEQADFTHKFSFQLPSDADGESQSISVQLQDTVAGKNGSADYDDVGLQLWGAAILFSELICASPTRFGLDSASLGSSPRIIELGAGTGLVSLVLGTLLPRLGMAGSKIIATDYHPAVLENLRSNVAHGDLPVETALLDWSSPTLEPPLDTRVKTLMATDVIYAPGQAVLLRDCAARLLAPGGTFWMFNAIRENGRFDGLDATVDAAFAEGQPTADGHEGVLKILESERIEKRKGIGRGNEIGYRLIKIGWA